jgi:hypothetical protein
MSKTDDDQFNAKLDAVVASIIARNEEKMAAPIDSPPTEYTYTDPEVHRLRAEVESARAWRMIILWIAGIIILGLVVGHPTDPPWTTY